MSYALIVEQLLNGVQFGVMLFLMAAGLTLVFGIMNMINLAHGSLYMAGAFIAAALIPLTGSFILAVLIALPLTGLLGAVLLLRCPAEIWRRGRPADSGRPAPRRPRCQQARALLLSAASPRSR